jgi:hypothetical protein
MGMGHGVAEGFGEGQTDPAAQLGVVGVSLDESVDAVTRARTGLGGHWERDAQGGNAIGHRLMGDHARVGALRELASHAMLGDDDMPVGAGDGPVAGVRVRHDHEVPRAGATNS